VLTRRAARTQCSRSSRPTTPTRWLGDKGYIGAEMITPIRKPPYRDMLDWEKKLNIAVNQIRYKIEQTIPPRDLADPAH